jgi:YhcN/YlaJ family sporulation lipoprotein
MSIKKCSQLATLCTFIFLLSACMDGGKLYGPPSADTHYGAPVENVMETERAYQTQQLYGPVSHDNKQLTYSKVLSDRVNDVNGVNTAIVMVTDHNAYVAILIDNTAASTKGNSRETNNQGTNTGIYNPNAPDTDYMQPNSLNTGVNNYETAINHDLLAHRFKQRIAEKVRSLQPHLMDVYISANRGFVNEMNNYAQESWKGNSLAPYIPKFNQLVTKVFGTNQVLPKD